MPLTIEYRPFKLPPAPVAGDEGAAARAVVLPELKPRDFTARIRRRDMVSVRRTLAGPRIWRQRLGGVAAIGALGMALGSIGWASPGGILPAHAEAGSGKLEPFETPGESFPGSAFYYVDPHDSGLIAPNLAEQAWTTHRDDEEPARFSDPAGPAARPITLAGSWIDRTRALDCLTAAIYYEAASEPDGGQRAVAQVVLNRVAHPAFPKTVCGVVYQGSERAGCQFSFACDGSLARKPVPAFWDRARRVAADALAGYVYAPVGLATHYHTAAVHPAWDNAMIRVGTIGAHLFFRWPGAVGSAAAFDAVYAGHEPVAAPHPRTMAPEPFDNADPITLARAFEAGKAEAQAAAGTAPGQQPPAGFGQAPQPRASAPAFTPEVQSRGGDSLYRSDSLPGSGGVKAEYQNSGRWIAQPGT
ncbi:MAG: cell wall hydrolase [Sphingomonadales bacterium]|nr:cell wall hydrolase [Sphingomonadales bacterium]MDE2570474.1 cell wall hydrolase [Sphingomonadales bacterium]